MDKQIAELNPKLLNLVDYLNPILNSLSKKVKEEEIDSPFIQGIVDRMLELATGKGHSEKDSRQMVGLAAVQLGVNKRIISIDLDADGSLKEQNLQIIINPTVTDLSKETVLNREGCWSCGNICGIVERSRHLVISGIDRFNKPLNLELTDFPARIAQHEIDHLNGIRFPDRIPLDQPSRLHWVEPDQFADYRTNWNNWPSLCPRELWDDMKAGTVG